MTVIIPTNLYDTGPGGWTTITNTKGYQYGFNGSAPASDVTMVIYVSSSTGLDPGDGGFNAALEGSSAQPLKTILKGMVRLRAGSPDWLLLKVGDTFASQTFCENLSNSQFALGLDAQNPMVFSAYDPANPTALYPGTGAGRPVLTIGAATGFSSGNLGDFVAIMGIEFQGTGAGIIYGSLTPDSARREFVLIEDVKCNGCRAGINPHNITTLYINRSVITDGFVGSGGLDQGLLAAFIDNFYIRENLFNNNGIGGDPGKVHNIYLQGYADALPQHSPGDNSQVFPADFRGNISSLQPDLGADLFRAGGTIDNNLWVQATEGSAFGMPTNTGATVTNNVSLSFVATGEGQGHQTIGPAYTGDLYNLVPFTFANNILVHSDYHVAGSALAFTPGTSGTISNNIVMDWGNTGTTPPFSWEYGVNGADHGITGVSLTTAGTGGSFPTFTGSTEYQGAIRTGVNGEILTVSSLAPANSLVTHPLNSTNVGMFVSGTGVPGRTFIKSAVTTTVSAVVATGGSGGGAPDGLRVFRLAANGNQGVPGIDGASTFISGTVTGGVLSGALTVTYGGWFTTYPTNPVTLVDITSGNTWTGNPTATLTQGGTGSLSGGEGTYVIQNQDENFNFYGWPDVGPESMGVSGYLRVPVSNVPASGGTGAYVDVTVSGGGVATVTTSLDDGFNFMAGKDYLTSDTGLTVNSSDIGGISGFAFSVTDVAIITVGTNYTRQANTGAWDSGTPPPGNPSNTTPTGGWDRTIETYDSDKLGGPGTFADFIAKAKDNQKYQYDSRLTANAVNTYIRDGFGIGEIQSDTINLTDLTNALGGHIPAIGCIFAGTLGLRLHG